MSASPDPVFTRSVVTDTGPLISLERLTNGFPFIRQLYDRLIVPPAVLEEAAFGYDRVGDYVEQHGIHDLIEVHRTASQATLPEIERLHEGETQAIRLALSLGFPLLIEEAAGRKSALAAGVAISGIAGQILLAHRRGLLQVEGAEAMLAEMVAQHRIGERLRSHLVSVLHREASQRPR